MSTHSLEKYESTKEVDGIEKTARAQQQIEHQYTKWQAIKTYPRAFIYTVVSVWVMMGVGFENQAGGTVVSIPEFRKDFGSYQAGGYVLDSQWQSAISGGPLAACFLGSLVGSYFADRVGRKWILFVSTAASIGCIAIEFAATNIKVFFVGKFLNAIFLGTLQTVATTYVAEISPLALRGISVGALNLSLCFGPFVCSVVLNFTAYKTSRMAYRSIFLSQWVFAATALLLILVLPESPYYLVIKGKTDKAKKTLNQIYREEALSQAQLCIIQTTIREAEQLSDSTSILECVNSKNWKRTLAAISIFTIQPWSGVSYVTSYVTYYYELSGFTTRDSFRIAIGGQVLSVSGTVCALFVIDRFGRRAVLFYGLISLGILNLIIAALGIKKEKSYLTGSAAFMTMYNFFYNTGVGTLGPLCCSEIPTSKLRTKTLALGVSFNMVFQCLWQFVLPYMFNPNEANMGSKINFIFAAVVLGSLAYFYFYLPETANRSFEEIDEMYIDKLPPRKFKDHLTSKEKESEAVFEETKQEVKHIENV